MKFRKKPVVSEAQQFTLDCNHHELAKWCGGKFFDTCGQCGILIPTLEGEMKADILDWIIKGVNGEFYPCKPDIFEKTYEPVLQEDIIQKWRKEQKSM